MQSSVALCLPSASPPAPDDGGMADNTDDGVLENWEDEDAEVRTFLH